MGIALLVFILLELSNIALVPRGIADTIQGETTGTGTAVVGNVPPVIVSMGIYLPPSVSNLTDIEPWTTYCFNITASDMNQVQDVKNVTLTLTTLAGLGGVFDKTKSYDFQFDNTTGANLWKELTASGWVTSSYTYLNPTQSNKPSRSVTGTWAFAVKLARTAHKEATWTMKATVRDSASQTTTKTNGFAVNKYVSFTIPSSISWIANPEIIIKQLIHQIPKIL